MHWYAIEKLADEREREIAARARLAMLVPPRSRAARPERRTIRLALPRLSFSRPSRGGEVDCGGAAALAGGC